jgi:hypothetical protein
MYAAANKVTIIITRRIKSKFEPGGKKIFKSVDATNNNVISGTPRINSIKQTHTAFKIGRFDWRPSANNIPIGSDNAIPVTPIRTASINPPNLSESIDSEPKGIIDCNNVDKGLVMKSHQIIGNAIDAITPANDPNILLT